MLCVKSARAGNNLKEKKGMVNCNTSPSFTLFLTDGSVGSTALIERPSHRHTLSLSFAQLFSKPLFYTIRQVQTSPLQNGYHRQPHVCKKTLPARLLRLPGLSSRLPSEPWRPSDKAGPSHNPRARTPAAAAPTIPPASAGLPAQPKLPTDADTSGRLPRPQRSKRPAEAASPRSPWRTAASGQGRRPRRPALTRSTGRSPAAAGAGAWRRRRS